MKSGIEGGATECGPGRGRRIVALTMILGLTASLAAQEGSLLLGTEIDLGLEGQWRSAEVLVEDYKLKNGIDFQRAFFDRLPLGRLRFTLGAEEGFAMATEATLRPQWMGDWFPASNLPGTAAGEAVAIEKYFMSEGWLAYRAGNFEARMGRECVDLGGGLEGGLLPSLRLPYWDDLRLRARLGPLSFDWMTATLPSRRSWEVGANGNDPSYDVVPNEGVPAGSDLFGWWNEAEATSIVYSLHRFSWDFGAASLGISGVMVYARPNNRYDLTDFFPVISWHQIENLPSNLELVLDASWRPLEGLVVLAQGGFDDISADIIGFQDDGTPTIPAAVLGLRYELPIGDSKAAFYAEAGMTHKLWGTYDGRAIKPNVVIPLERYINRYLLYSGAALTPLSSPYGPGALWAKARAGWTSADSRWSVTPEFLFLARDSRANLIATPDPAASTAAHYDLWYAILAVPVSYRLWGVEARAAPAVSVRNGLWWTELGLSVAWRYANQKAVGGGTPW